MQAIEFIKNTALRSSAGRLLEKVFSDERCFQTLDWVKEHDLNHAIDFVQITNEFVFKYRPFRKKIFIVFQRIYWYLKRLITIFVG